MATHALAQTGTGGTAAGSTAQIGSDITLPAGGPWLIHHIWGMALMDTATPSEAVSGQLKVDSLSGDISPDPAPGKYPLIGVGASSGADSNLRSAPLNLYEVEWSGSGKATLKLSFVNDAGNAVAPITAGGIIFGDTRPEPRPLKFCDGVSTTLTADSEATVGTITLAEKATRIVGLFASLMKDGATTVDEAMLATIRIDSDDVKLPPAQYPCNQGYTAADGALFGGPSTPAPRFLPVDIPVVPGARIDCFATLVSDVTAGVDVQIFLAYE